MGINGGGETDDSMAGFDDCTTGTKGFCCSACDRRCKIVDSCVGVKPPDIAGSWVGVEDADDNESVCGVNTDGDDTVVSILAGVKIVIETEDVLIIAVGVVVGELALWMASKNKSRWGIVIFVPGGDTTLR